MFAVGFKSCGLLRAEWVAIRNPGEKIPPGSAFGQTQYAHGAYRTILSMIYNYSDCYITIY